MDKVGLSKYPDMMNNNKSSPTRPVLKQIKEDVNNESPILILSTSVDTKRDQLNQLYDDMKTTAERIRINIANRDTTEGSILKRVQFESIENENSIRIEDSIQNQNQNMNLTYTKEKFELEKAKTTSSQHGQTQVEIKSKLPVKISTATVTSAKTPATKSVNKTIESNKIAVQVVGSKVSTLATTTTRTRSKSPGLKPLETANRTNKILTYQQKKKLLTEAKEKLEKELQVLRKKVVVRKFAYIWLRKHFYSEKNFKSGKNLLLPSQLHSLYNIKLLRNKFTEWYSDAKFRRNEWRFNVKADCHYRYILRNKVWSVWKNFVIEQREQKKAENIALVHYNEKIKSIYFEHWKLFRIELIKNKLSLHQIQKQREYEILKENFDIWYFKLLVVKKMGKMNEIADRHHQLVKLSQWFSMWYFKFNTEKEERRKIRLAQQHHKIKLLLNCFNSLKMFTIYRRKKKLQKQKLAEYAESQLVYRTFHTWVEKYQTKKHLEEIQAEILQIKRRFLAKRAFNYWKTANEFRIKQRLKEARMKKNYEKKLKKKVFDALKLNLMDAKEELLKVDKAERFNNLWTRRIYFEKWEEKLEVRQEINVLHLIYKANKHYTSRLLLKCVNKWGCFIIEQREYNMKIKKADDFHKKNILKNYLDIIKTYVEITKYKRHNHMLAEEFYKQNTWEKYFTLWYQNYQITIELQMNTRIAILHDESNTIEKVFNHWYSKYMGNIQFQIKENRAICWFDQKLRLKSFKSWLETVRENKKEIDTEAMAIQHDLKRVCLPIFTHWKTIFEKRQALNQRCLAITKSYESKLVKKLFDAWSTQTKVFKQTNQIVNEMFTFKQRQMCAEMFFAWRRSVRQSKSERENENLAATFYLKHLMHTILSEWSAYAKFRVAKAQNDHDIIEKFEKTKHRLITGSIFNVWSQKTKLILAEQSKENIASKFYHHKLCNQMYAKWRIFTVECARSKLQEKQADWFFEMRIKTEIFFKWSLKYQEEVDLRDKNMKALLMWSINVKKSYFEAWFGWYRKQKEKSERYKLALENRQIDILRNCGQKFLIYSSDSKQRRLYASRLLKERFQAGEIELELKYFYLWRSKCKFSKQNNLKIEPPKDTCLNKALVRVETSLERREKVTNVISNPELIIEMRQQSRPAPRKPNYLLESVDVKPKNQEKPPTLSNPNVVLIPPTAFTRVAPVFINANNEFDSVFDENRQKRVQFEELTSRSGIDAKESMLSPFDSKNPSSYSSDSVNSDMGISKNKKKENGKNEWELLEIKKRLENLTIKSNKLKRLKEQEKLLVNCIKSNEINNTSMCETIYQEREQVELEIEELSKFLKNEKNQVNELLKKYKIN